MRELIRRPEGPLAGFVHGATATAFAVGVPLTVQIILMTFVARKPLLGLVLSVGFTLAASLTVGILTAVWRQIQCWAYDRFTGEE